MFLLRLRDWTSASMTTWARGTGGAKVNFMSHWLSHIDQIFGLTLFWIFLRVFYDILYYIVVMNRIDTSFSWLVFLGTLIYTSHLISFCWDIWISPGLSENGWWKSSRGCTPNFQKHRKQNWRGFPTHQIVSWVYSDKYSGK